MRPSKDASDLEGSLKSPLRTLKKPKKMAAQAPQDAMEAHDQDNSQDEGLGWGMEDGSTASLRSSILHYRAEHGRTYHSYKEGKYSYPNDESENDRLDLQHHVFQLTYDGKLGLCPLNEKVCKVGRVLDIGCGTGIWAVDYGDEHPEATVVGVDLSPIQPQFVPPNVEFTVDDVEEPWTFSKKFDYIHSRMMTTSFSDWKSFLQKCYENLEPGGCLELADIDASYESDDGTLTESHAVKRWRRLLAEAAKERGRPFNEPKTYKAALEDLGFVDVQEVLHKWPLNPWPRDKKLKELGAWTFQNVSDGIEAFSLALLSRVLGWSREEIEVLLADVRRELRDRSIHAYIPVYTVYGRKPTQ
ncbi:S-adenosyl-L-methionine-dependent methyltransferase [Pleurostoma richardsiae]|uniref:S-adenosyl-L-methionine-dependent methyltransferase n=1 Tax=Pleurostoma richardsiae TaxID=41990 RepID=A0AA38RJS6_9PEZI|nr:S-adenosyl-L-methionine-dependent methyltransferase [Pleurostoma richardsiae]